MRRPILVAEALISFCRSEDQQIKKKNDSSLLQEALEPHYIYQVGGDDYRQRR